MTDWLDEHGNSWNVWKSQADDLLHSAQILHNQSDNKTWDAELLLYGYAIELLLKCWYLKQNKRIYVGGKFMLKARSHNLVQLAKELGYPLDPKFNNMLSRLSKFIQWAGRYPVPLDEKTGLSAYWGSNDDQLLQALIESICQFQ